MADMIDPIEYEVKAMAGDMRKYVISKFPAIAGREIVSNYPLSALPKIGDYKSNEVTMLKLMSYVGVNMPNGTVLRLGTIELINNHVPDWETLAKVEVEMLRYNTSFFGRGEVSSFLVNLTQKYLISISPTLKALSVSLSQTIKQHYENSKKPTP
jgi:hypothetical protein